MLTTLDEHLGYVSDSRRLDLFRRAVAATIRPGDAVADLGCGVGVLGLLCLEAGARHVWGIDRTDAIETARETMARAGLADRYTSIRDHVSRTVLPEPVDVLVCDHVGYLGVDYGIVDMVADARRRLLKPGGRIVPGRIRLILAGVASEPCRQEAEAWAAPTIPAQYHWLRDYGINTKHGREFGRDEIATAPTPLGTVDLGEDNPALLSFSATLQAERPARLDGLAGWFECELAAGVWMTNSPLAEEKIDRPQAFLPFDRPLELASGDRAEIALSIRHDSALISWSLRDPRSGQRQKQSTWSSRILAEADLARNPGKRLVLNRDARARRIVADYVDGKLTADAIVAAVLRSHPDLFPTREETERFVRHELARSTS